MFVRCLPLSFLLALCCASFSLWAQEGPIAIPSQAPVLAPTIVEKVENSKALALESLTKSIRAEEAERNNLREALKKTLTDDQKKDLTDDVERISAKIKELKRDFTTTATGINPEDSTVVTDENLSINDELKNIFQPMAREIRESTAQPREIAKLSSELIQWKNKTIMAQTAIRQIDDLLAETISDDLRKELTTSHKSWQKRLQEAESRVANIAVQLEERKRNAPSVFNLITNFISHFWKNRGLSLLLSLSGSILAWYILRRIYLSLKKYSPVHKRYQDTFTTRLFDVFANIFIVFAALFTAIIILYVRNDWLLLTAALIVVIGLAWASRTALPPYFEQIRLILNLGTVRQGERVIINGLPWRVDTINFFCVLSNPDLNGGSLRIPAKNLLVLHSRPNMPKEPWFPSRIDDWVKLDDGIIGKVIQQTPEQVVLVRLGGAYKTYTTMGYLAKFPENISSQFSVSTIFGIDYQYQKIATTLVPQIIQDSVLKLLLERFDRAQIKSVKVDFAAAAASSLDYLISASVDGELAPQHEAIKRLLQRGAVDAANENDWVIPFPQMTLHRSPD